MSRRFVGNVLRRYFGTFLASDGAVGTPSHTFRGDPDTGMFLIGANNLGFGTAGAEALDIDSAGIITMPLQCLVHTRPNGNKTNVTGGGTNYTTVWDSEIVDRNADFDGTSTFTAPVTGLYMFSGFIHMSGLTSSETALSTSLVTSNRTYAAVHRMNPVNVFDSGTLFSMPFAQMADMDASDTATFTLQILNGTDVVDFQSNSVLSIGLVG